MTAPFFTKKQKAEMRKRRQKRKLTTEGVARRDDDQEHEEHQPETKRQKQQQDNSLDRTSNIANSTNSQSPSSTATHVVTIPAHLSAKEARKFRKDTRRRVRAEGGDESLLEFVVEGEEQQEEKDVDTSSTSKRKPKRSFPRINELLQQEKEKERLAQEETARKDAEARIPDEIKSRYVALDCEMVGIGSGGKQSALARVSLVDWHLNTVLDTFVKVPSKVTDFRTFVSGIRAKDIKSKAAMDVVECRRTVAEILKNKVLVGHALKNDLQALLLQHPKEHIRDTAKYRPFQRASGPNGGKWRARKLRDLVKEHLGQTIQVHGESHDSVEDAKATMELFQRVREPWEKELEAKAKKNSRKGR